MTYSLEAETYNITYAYKTNDVEIAAADIAGLKNDNPTTFTVEDAITISAANITAMDFDVASVDNEGWAAGAKTDNVTVTVTFTAKAPAPTWPETWPDADQSVKDKFAAWKDKYSVTDFTGNEAGDTLEAMAPKALTYWTTVEGKANVQIEANFIKAVIGFKAPKDVATRPACLGERGCGIITSCGFITAVRMRLSCPDMGLARINTISAGVFI